MSSDRRGVSLNILLAILFLLPGAGGGVRAQTTNAVIGTVAAVGDHTLDLNADSKTYHFVLSPNADTVAHTLSPNARARVFYIQADVLVATRVEGLN